MSQLPKDLACKFGAHVVTFPRCWERVTLSQFLRIASAEMTDEHVLRSLASDEALLLQMPDPMAAPQILAKLPFLATRINVDTLPTPTTLTLGGKTINVPPSLGLETFGQKLAVDNALKDLQADGVEINPTNAATAILSIYLYPLITGKPFSADQYDAVTPDILTLPVTAALPLAAFFLRSYQTLTPSGLVTYQVLSNEIPTWRSLGARLRNWLGTFSSR